MALIGVEMRRGLARRSTRGLLLVALIGIAIIGVSIFATSRATFDSAGSLAQAESLRNRALVDCVNSNGFGGELRRSGVSLTEVCEETIPPANQFVRDKRFHLTDLWTTDGTGDDGDNLLQVTALFLAIGALMGGATFIGGEWRWATMTTLLTWEPRRARVFLAKAAATLLLTFLIGVILQVLVGLSVLPAALWRGTTSGADAEWFRGASGAVVRASALGSGAALFGYAVAFIGRNTAAALGVAFAYVSVFEALVRGLKPGWQRWLIGENSAVFLTGRQLRSADFERSVLEAGLILVLYLAAVLGAAAFIFGRRDVT
ncbi:MAG: ABC transporter permease subunit [Acidimicrobiales bacterium]